MTRPTFDVVDWASTDVTLPGIGGPNKQIPILDLQQKGYDMNQKPAADEFNYILYNFSTWLKYLDEKSGGASPDTPVIDSTPSTTPLRDVNGKGCFKGIRDSDTTNVRELDFTASYNGVNAIAMKANGTNIGYFASTKLTGPSDTVGGWAGNTFGIHYGGVVGTVTGDCTGTAGSAAKWTTARTLTLTGFVQGSTTLDGSANKTITTVYGSGFDSIVSTSGYQKLPSGLILQWGVFEDVNNSLVSFPIAFPNGCFGVNFFANDVWSDGDGNDQTCKSVTSIGFIPYQEAYYRKFFYMALGH